MAGQSAPSRSLLSEVLGKLEKLELPLLSWGVTEGVLSSDDVDDAIAEVLADSDEAVRVGPQTIRSALIDRGLLFPIPLAGPAQYRTRLAEGLRLTATLRQQFPPRNLAAEGWWREGRRLVADYRLHVAQRQYPKRSVSSDEAVARLERMPGWSSLHTQVARSQIGAYNLAEFQVEAASAVSGALAGDRSRGVIVGAGTGSGKTLAFYLPAFAAIAADAAVGHVHTLALYPRIELLRDQLRTAVKTALTLAEHTGRQMRIGVLYTATPPRATRFETTADDPSQRPPWEQRPDGYLCPYLTCPHCDQGRLIWRQQDIRARREVLTCDACNTRLPEWLLCLTRDSIQHRPPQLLFTTTEMLNRHSSGSYLSPALGWSDGPGPRLVLLDEVHTYSGASGAQTALLLRRWQHARRAPVTFVGLSATLKQADRFLAQLTGLPIDDVRMIEPRSHDMDREGQEYSLALRGDPIAGVSLASVTIQTSMLHTRLLDHSAVALDQTLHGSKSFLFTDNLDVINRLYDQLRDAEGSLNFRGGSDILAALRAPGHSHHEQRYRDGQSWDLPVRLGHILSEDLRQRPLAIGRTSSQDAGVDSTADLIVATASLEVGFDDPRVGLVLQHKAPRDPASFLQRRGRAGRTRGTHPMTVVILSDFGRDRLAYQGYDALFSPEIPARTLPIRNRHIIKIQGTLAFVDWLGRVLASRGFRADARMLLSGPRRQDRQDRQGSSQPTPEQQRVIEVLEKLLDGNDAWLASLARHLRGALQLDDAEVQALLWEQPRSIMLSVVPTIRRRLLAGRTPMRRDPGIEPKAFLPEFVTRALFDSLNLPEVAFDIPFDPDADEHLAVGRALREAVPGRVSRRYGHRSDRDRTWLPVPIPPNDGLALDVEELGVTGQLQGTWNTGLSDVGSLPVVRPYRIRLSSPPREIDDRSQAQPQWATQIVESPASPPRSADVPGVPAWQPYLRAVAFATHTDGNPVDVRRMTYGAGGELIQARTGNRRSFTVRYKYQEESAALGFALTVDALKVDLAPLETTAPVVEQYLRSPQWRAKAFTRRVSEDPRIAAQANVFQRGWLVLVYLTAFALEGLDGKDSREIHAALANGAWAAHVQQIIQVLYRQDPLQAAGQPASGPAERVVTDLLALSQQGDLASAMDEAARVLFSDDVAAMTGDLARRAYRDTIAAAVLETVLRVCPDAQDDDITVDVIAGPEGAADTVWISETATGGLGIIEAVAQRYGPDPARFWSLVSAALRPNSFEHTDTRLTHLLQHIVHDEPQGALARAITALRQAQDSQQAQQALETIKSAWADLDGPPRHSDIAALAARLLRPGSDNRTDEAAHSLITGWDRLEQQTGVEVDARVVAYAAGSGRLPVPGELNADQVFSMLWPRGDQARNHHLEVYQPYRPAERPAVLDRLLAAAVHTETHPRIGLADPQWVTNYQQALAEHRMVELTCPLNNPALLHTALLQIPLIPIERDVLKIYGEVQQVVRESTQVVAKVAAKEAEQ